MTRKMNECKRCGWVWFPTTVNPKVCPKCKTPYWDSEKKKQTHISNLWNAKQESEA